MATLAERDYFTDHSILLDPYAFFEAIRAHGPIYRHPVSGIVYVTGYEETLDVLKNTQDFSSALAVQGPNAPLPFEPTGHDIAAQIDASRLGFLGGDLLVTMDDRPHAQLRSLLTKLFTPSRLKANEAFIADYSEQLVRNAVAHGGCELIKEIATPFVTLVIADLLDVPPDDRQVFMDAIEAAPPPGSLDAGDDLAAQNQPLVLMGLYFADYVTDRRANPGTDVLSELATATLPDGTMPDPLDIVRLATFLFGAGQDTSAKLLGNTMRFLVEDQALQDRVRADPALIPALLEEVLRLEGSTKMTGRLARRDTRIGDIAVPAGTRVMLALSAANRDPARWEEPGALRLDRPRIKEHVGFGRGAHVCPGAPLARVEVRVILERFLRHTKRIALSETEHGPADDRTLEYDPSFIIRGLSQLHLTLTPADDFEAPPAPKKPGMFARLRRMIAGDGVRKDAPKRRSTAETSLGDLLDDPAARAIVDRHFPGVADDKRIAMARGMTLRRIQRFAPEIFTDAALAAADADLAGLPPR